jgi:flagellar biosynthesis/type III secretory pathway chaperone
MNKQKKTTGKSSRKILVKNTIQKPTKKQNSAGKKEIRKYLKRKVIKLGNSYAVTYPEDFIKSLADENEEIAKSTVHCYKINPRSILIRKDEAESEKTILNIDISKFPIELVGNLINNAQKLNVNTVNLDYQEDHQYDLLISILNEFKITPIFNENRITFDLSKNILYKFSDQLKGMTHHFSKIIELSVKFSGKPTTPDKISTIDDYMSNLNRNYKEALSTLIKILNNFYLHSENGMSNIINTLGNRVLISHIKNISKSASNLFYSKNTEEFTKYMKIIESFPGILKKEISMATKSNEINEINDLSKILEEKESLMISLKSVNGTVNEEIIFNVVKSILEALKDIMGIILTRWVEDSVVYE